MKSLVSKLSQERKQHIDTIENMTFRNLKVSVSSPQLTLHSNDPTTCRGCATRMSCATT